MSRYYWSKKEEADSLKKIEVWWLKKHGYLTGGFRWGGIKWTNGWSGKESNISFFTSIYDENSYLQLKYTQTDNDGNKLDFDYKVPLTTTLCYFGGKRYWFICPWYANGKYCGRRVGVLYLGGKYFACRHCYNLTYSIRNASRISRIGSNVSFPELDKLNQQIKRKFYKGKITRKYQAYLNKERKLYLGMAMFVEAMERGKK